MPTTDPVLIVEQQLWSIALAWPDLGIGTGNVIRFDKGVAGSVTATAFPPIRPTLQPGDTPQLKLEITGSTLDPRAPRTMCLQPDVNAVSFDWTLIGSDQTYNALTQAVAELKAAMKNTDTSGGKVAAGVQLGMPETVARWEWAWRANQAPPSGTKKRQIIITQKITIKG